MLMAKPGMVLPNVLWFALPVHTLQEAMGCRSYRLSGHGGLLYLLQKNSMNPIQ